MSIAANAKRTLRGTWPSPLGEGEGANRSTIGHGGNVEAPALLLPLPPALLLEARPKEDADGALSSLVSTNSTTARAVALSYFAVRSLS